MNGNCKLDERQIFVRSEAFKHGLLFMGLVVLFDSILKDSNINLVEGMWGNILLIACTIAIIYTEMIFRNGIDYEDLRMNRVLMLLGTIGFVLLVWVIFDIIRDGIIIRHSYIIPKNIAELIMAILWFWIGAAFYVKKHKVKYED